MPINQWHGESLMGSNGKPGIHSWTLANVLQLPDSAIAEALKDVEQAARKEHAGMWQYGDPGEDSDEEADRPKNAWGRR